MRVKMKNFKKNWFVVLILVVVLLGSGAGMVSADLEAFLVRSVDGDYYQYSEEQLNYSFLSYQLDATSAIGKMYQQFEGLLKAGGKVVGLKDSVKGYMDYQATGTAFLMAQLQQLDFNVNQYLALDSAKVMAETIGRLFTVDPDGQATEVIETIPLVTYDEAGTYGPATGTETISNDVTINVPAVTLQNLHISGNLTIGEGVGSGDVTLNNVVVDGDTFVRGGGKNSIHIYGGSYNKITVEKTATGEVRIVATNAAGLEIVVSNDATGEDVILEGDFANVTVNAPDVVIKTQGETTIEKMNVAEAATGCQVNLAEGTEVKNVVLDSAVDIKGKGTVDNAEINSDGVKFETKPTTQQVAETVTVPPVVTPPTPPPSNPDPPYIAVTEVKISSAGYVWELAPGDSLQMYASISPTNATNKNVTWSVATSENDTGEATISASGLLTATNPGWVTVNAKNQASGQESFTMIKILSELEIKLKAYEKAISIWTEQPQGDSQIIVDYYGLTDEIRNNFVDYSADLKLIFSRPLTGDEKLTVSAFGNSKELSASDLSSEQLEKKLSEIITGLADNNPLTKNDPSTWAISITGQNLSSEVMVMADSILTSGGTEQGIKSTCLSVFPTAIKSYFDALEISINTEDLSCPKYVLNYAKELSTETKTALNDYYSDADIYLNRPLEDGETVEVTAFEKTVTITNQQISGNSIRLSQLITPDGYSDSQLAKNQTGSHEIAIKAVSLNSAINIGAAPILVKGENVVSWVSSLWLDVYSSGVIHAAEKTLLGADQNSSEFTLTYQNGLTEADKAGLSGYYADAMISIDRPLLDDEAMVIEGFSQKVSITNANMPSANQWFSLSELLGANPELAYDRKGIFAVTVKNESLKTNLNINLTPVLTKQSGETVFLTNFNEGRNKSLKLAAGTEQIAPQDLVVVAPTTVGGSDGQITGVTEAMEYLDNDNGIWKKVIGTEITGLKAREYLIRFAGTKTANASNPLLVRVLEPASVPKTLEYDQGSSANLVIPVTLNDNYLQNINDGNNSLGYGQDYTVEYGQNNEPAKVILTSDYLQTRTVGDLNLTLEFYGMTAPCTVTISNSGFNLAVTKLENAPSDDNYIDSQANQNAVYSNRTGKTVTVYGDLDALTAYQSTDPSQTGEKKWIGLIVDTGEDSIIEVKYGDYAFTQDDVDDAKSVGAPAGNFVLWIDAAAVAVNPKTFTLTKGDKNTTITINFKESKVSFLTSLVPNEKVVLVKLYKPDPLSYAVSYGETILEYDPVFQEFKANIPINTAENLEPTITKTP